MRLRILAAALATGAAALALTAVPASAKGEPSGAACFTYTLDDRGWKDELWVWNTCKTEQRFKIKLANKQDYPCYSMAGKGSGHYWWGYPGRFDGIVSC